jgi:hypothetical protein
MSTTSEMWKPWSLWAPVALVPLVVILSSGCGDGRPVRVPVSGRVLIDGKPLEAGNIRFHAASNRPASAKIEPDGRFTLSTYDLGDGCVTGVHPVSVVGSKLLNPHTMHWYAPKKYAGAGTSGLTFEVTGPTDSAEIKLFWAGGKPFDERILGGGD